jgi:hypothetical protein
MARVASFAIPDKETEVMERFKEIAKREGKTTSQVIWSLIKDYVQKHSQNPAMPLTRWVEQPNLPLFPTLGDTPSPQKLMQFPKHQLVELKQNAEAYYSLSEDLLRWMDKHERDHAKLGYKDSYCPYCRE